MNVSFERVPYLAGGRDLCVTGTCVLTARRDLLGRAIRLFERGGAWCSHAAPVVRLPAVVMSRDRVTLIEALAHGLTPTFLSRYFGAYKGRIFLFIPEGLTWQRQTAFTAWLLDKTFGETGYDYAALLLQLLGRVSASEARLFCSEAWALAAQAAGLARTPGAPQKLAPQPPDIPRWWPGRVVELIGPFVQE